MKVTVTRFWRTDHTRPYQTNVCSTGPHVPFYQRCTTHSREPSRATDPLRQHLPPPTTTTHRPPPDTDDLASLAALPFFEKQSALVSASFGGWLPVVEALLDAGAKPMFKARAVQMDAGAAAVGDMIGDAGVMSAVTATLDSLADTRKAMAGEC